MPEPQTNNHDSARERRGLFGRRILTPEEETASKKKRIEPSRTEWPKALDQNFVRQRVQYVHQRTPDLLNQLLTSHKISNWSKLRTDSQYLPDLEPNQQQEYIHRCAELIAHYEFGLIAAVQRMNLVWDDQKIQEYTEELLDNMILKWDSQAALATAAVRTRFYDQSDPNEPLIPIVTLNLYDVDYSFSRDILPRQGGAVKPGCIEDIMFFAAVEEAAHTLFYQFRRNKRTGEVREGYQYPIPDPSGTDPGWEGKYKYAREVEFRALLWKASFDELLGTELGFNKQLALARSLIAHYKQGGKRAVANWWEKPEFTHFMKRL